MDYEKKYNDALNLAKSYYGKDNNEFLDTMFPELRESEDERIRKAIIELLKEIGRDDTGISENAKCMIAYLEKQKEQKVDIDKLRRDIYQSGYNDGYQHGKEDAQKEQKPPIAGNDFGWIDELKHDLEHPEELDQKVDDVLKQRKGIRALEWSKEDEHRRNDAIYFLESAMRHYADTSEIEKTIAWLKSLRPQPHKEVYQAAKHDLAIKFMEYLDKNRPEGKMCLSNGECEDIDKAFKENDWAKIMRYIEKYRPHWKPSEEQIGALDYAYCELFKRKDVGHNILGPLQKLCDELKKLM